MIYSEPSLARRIFTEFLPPWASRIGYIDGVSAPETLVPPHIFPIPLNVAPAGSLDGIWIDSSHAPRTVPDLAATLASLGPGGIGILFLPVRFWRRRDLRRFCQSADAQIVFLSPVPSKGKIQLNRRGLPVPKSFFRRLLMRGATFFFPGLSFLFGSEWFIILQKSIGRSRENDGVRLSIVVPLAEDREQARKRLREWEQFLSHHRMHDIQLVAVDESEGDPLEGMAGSTIRVHHYRNFGRSQAIRSGLFSARGKTILIDSDRYLSPAFLFDLLQERFREHQASDVLSGYDEGHQPSWWSRLTFRFISGLSRPDPLYMLISDRAARSILDLHPEQLRGYVYAIPLHLRKAGMKVREIALHPDPPLASRSGALPSLLGYLRYRLRRGAVYLLLLFWFPFVPQLAAHMHSEFAQVRPEAGRIGRTILSARSTARPEMSVPASLAPSTQAFFGTVQAVLSGISTTDGLRWSLAEWEWAEREVTAREALLKDFFFVLLIGVVLHVHNSAIVFRVSSGTILAFLSAMLEAGLLYGMTGTLEGRLPFGLPAGMHLPGSGLFPVTEFASGNPFWIALPLFLALVVSRILSYPLYSLVFRRAKGRSPT